MKSKKSKRFRFRLPDIPTHKYRRQSHHGKRKVSDSALRHHSTTLAFALLWACIFFVDLFGILDGHPKTDLKYSATISFVFAFGIVHLFKSATKLLKE